MKNTIASINPMINKIHAIFAAVPAMPLKPKIAAMIAIIKKVRAHPNMIFLHSNK